MLAGAGLAPWDAPPDPFHQYVCFSPWPGDGEYEKVQKIAEAIHGKVYLYKHLPTGGSLCVVKKMDNKNVMFSRPSCMEDARAEIGVSTYLAKQRCTALDSVKYLMASSKSFQDEDYTYFVSDYVQKGELFNHVKDRGGFPEPIAREFAKQVLEGVASMHSHGVAHRDISLENVLLGADDTVRLIDFGQAVMIWDTNCAEERPAKHRGRAGKQYYRAPEMYSGEYEGQPVDAFAVGVLIFILVLGTPPWDSALDTDQRFRFIQTNGLQKLLTAWKMQDRISPVLVDLLQNLMKRNPQDRMTIADARQHAWFQ
jgi:serine/threonine protein kinase